MHEIIRHLSLRGFVLMTGIPIVMTVAALVFGWYAKQSIVRRRAAEGSSAGPAEDAFLAAATVAMVPFAFAALLLWERLR